MPYEILADTPDQLMTQPEDVDNESRLLQAAGGNIDEVKRLLSAGTDVNTTDDQGTTPLMMAAMGNAVDIVWVLINSQARLDAADILAMTALHHAAILGSTSVAEALIIAGANVNAAAEIRHNVWEQVCTCPCHEESQGETPLHLAALNGHSEIVLLLLKNRGDIHAQTLYGETPKDYSLKEWFRVISVASYCTNCEPSITNEQRVELRKVYNLLNEAG
jgi:uncharacterized protein